ncbi:MAG TPA: response regulator [Ktedonobacterales bacterium]
MQPRQPCGVLVVDDDMALRDALRLLLEDAGHVVDEAPDGAVALDMLQLAEHPLVVLLDFMMPGMSGLELLHEVTHDDDLCNGHHFILVTANSALLPAGLLGLLTIHAIPVVAKPFDLDTLLATVAHACDEIRARR